MTAGGPVEGLARAYAPGSAITLCPRVAPRVVSVVSAGSRQKDRTMTVSGNGLEYETVAAGQTAQVLGATGSVGDFLSHVIFQPTTLSPGTCTILDGAIVVFTFTTGTLLDLRPIIVPLNLFSVSDAWKITTGANITAVGVGDFT